MSALAQRRAQFALKQNLSVSAVKVFSRGVRRTRKTVGNDVNVWLKGPGSVYKDAAENGTNWLGKTHPFPMNPSFKPAPPVSNATKDEIYDRFMTKPKGNSIRELSQAYHISLKRVDAILRLKGLEESWKKGKEIQTGFVAGMERILQPKILTRNGQPFESRSDVNAADLQDENEVDARARDRYQRLFWEPVADDERPILPRMLEEAKLKAREARSEAATAKSNKELLTGEVPKTKDSEKEKDSNESETLPLWKPRLVKSKGSRPGVMFKDVGGRFLDVEDRTRRMHEAERRRVKRAT